jgi:hypothetical protein
VLGDDGRIDPHKLDAVGRCGGNWYVRASGDALFEIAKPLATKGIGVDSIPDDIRNSSVLTGNDLGKLGNVESLPDETEVNDYKLMELSDLFMDHQDAPAQLEIELHKLAAAHLAEGRTSEAWKTLLSFNDR